MAGANPCISCGACCSYFEVRFYWREADTPGGPPLALTVDAGLDSMQKIMKGTEGKTRRRCVALKGTIGECVSCGIYERRPEPCRRFSSNDPTSNGEPNSRCDEARRAHQLPPLRPYSDTSRDEKVTGD